MMDDRPDDLPPELTAQLAADLREQALGPMDRFMLKQRLLNRVRSDACGTPSTTVRNRDEGWKPLMPKVQIRVLRRDAETMSYLLRLEPGAEVPSHPHPIDEECMVLEGELQIGELSLGAGDFHLAHRGVPHGVLSSRTGATIYLRGARLHR